MLHVVEWSQRRTNAGTLKNATPWQKRVLSELQHAGYNGGVVLFAHCNARHNIDHVTLVTRVGDMSMNTGYVANTVHYSTMCKMGTTDTIRDAVTQIMHAIETETT